MKDKTLYSMYMLAYEIFVRMDVATSQYFKNPSRRILAIFNEF